MVKLKNGAETMEGPARGMFAVLSQLLERETVVFIELVFRCRDRNHKFFGTTGERLTELKFLDHTGQPHSMVRDIILSAVTGDGMDMALGSPFAGLADGP